MQHHISKTYEVAKGVSMATPTTLQPWVTAKRVEMKEVNSSRLVHTNEVLTNLFCEAKYR